MATLVKPTAFHSFEFPNSIRLTPKLSAEIVTEFIKQLLYIKEQLAAPLDELIVQSKKVDAKRNLKLLHLIQALDECEQSLCNIFQFHFSPHHSHSHAPPEVAWIDILLIFGKSYVHPSETYSLRFYIERNDDDDKTRPPQQQTMDIDAAAQTAKIKAIVARNLHSMERIWDSNLPLTDLRIVAHIQQHEHQQHQDNEKQEQDDEEEEEEEQEEEDEEDATSDEYFSDSRFVIKHNLCIRFGALRKQKQATKGKQQPNSNNLYLVNIWNKRTASKIAKSERLIASVEHKNKENVTPKCQIHDVQRLAEKRGNDMSGSSKIWYVSNFKIGGLKLKLESDTDKQTEFSRITRLSVPSTGHHNEEHSRSLNTMVIHASTTPASCDVDAPPTLRAHRHFSQHDEEQEESKDGEQKHQHVMNIMVSSLVHDVDNQFHTDSDRSRSSRARSRSSSSASNSCRSSSSYSASEGHTHSLSPSTRCDFLDNAMSKNRLFRSDYELCSKLESQNLQNETQQNFAIENEHERERKHKRNDSGMSMRDEYVVRSFDGEEEDADDLKHDDYYVQMEFVQHEYQKSALDANEENLSNNHTKMPLMERASSNHRDDDANHDGKEEEEQEDIDNDLMLVQREENKNANQRKHREKSTKHSNSKLSKSMEFEENHSERTPRRLESITVLSKPTKSKRAQLKKSKFTKSNPCLHVKRGHKSKKSATQKRSSQITKTPSRRNTNAGTKQVHFDSNHYKHLEQQMIDSLNRKYSSNDGLHRRRHRHHHQRTASNPNPLQLTQSHSLPYSASPIVHSTGHSPVPLTHSPVHVSQHSPNIHSQRSSNSAMHSPISESTTVTQSPPQSPAQPASQMMHPGNIVTSNISFCSPPPGPRRVKSMHSHLYHPEYSTHLYAQHQGQSTPSMSQPQHHEYSVQLFPQTHQHILPSLTHRQLSSPVLHSNQYIAAPQPPPASVHPSIQHILNYGGQNYSSSPTESPQTPPTAYPAFTYHHTHPPPYRNRFHSVQTHHPMYNEPSMSNKPRSQTYHEYLAQPPPQHSQRPITTFHPHHKNQSSPPQTTTKQQQQHNQESPRGHSHSPQQKHLGPHPLMLNRSLTFYAYDHENGRMIQLDTPLLSRTLESYITDSPQTTSTPLSHSQTPTKSPTKTLTSKISTNIDIPTPTQSMDSDEVLENNHNIENSNDTLLDLLSPQHENSKHWNIAESYGEKYILTDYALKHFQIAKHRKKASLFSSKHDHENDNTLDLKLVAELVKYCPFKRLKYSLLRMETREMDKIGMQIWKNINSYIGSRKSSKSNEKHIEKILKIALSDNITKRNKGNNNNNKKRSRHKEGDDEHDHDQYRQMIRDEIFCQIIKQTNIDSRSSEQSMKMNNLGWHIMCICCSCITPSEELCKYLTSYLYRKMRENENSEIAQYAKFSLNALTETMGIGTREMVPTNLEITTLINRQPIKIDIYFLDNSYKSILISSQTTSKQVCNVIAKQLKLSEHSAACFALYEMEELSIAKRYEAELKAYNSRLDMSYKEKLDRLQYMPMNRELGEQQRIMDVFSSWYQFETKTTRNFKFVFKMKICNKKESVLHHHNHLNRNEKWLIYLDHAWNVSHAQYPIQTVSDIDVFELICIQLQEKYQWNNSNNVNLSHIDISKYIPQSVLNKYSVKQCTEFILQRFAQNNNNSTKHSPFLSKEECWRMYLKQLLHANQVSLFVGCVFFRCVRKIKRSQPSTSPNTSPKSKPGIIDSEDFIVGINEDAILLIHPLTKQIVMRYKLEQILTYGYRSNSFIIVAGKDKQHHKYSFGTPYAKHMNDVLQKYIDIRTSLSSL